MGGPVEVIDRTGMVFEMYDRLVLFPGIDESNFFLVKFDHCNVVVIILVPGDPQKLAARFVKNVRLWKISDVKLPACSIGTYCSKDVGVRRETDIIYLLVVGN